MIFMPRGSKVAPKKKQPVESVHDRDRIIVRLPDGLRDQLAAFAEANGRSMTAEVVAAIQEHLRGATRIAQLWDFFERHRQNIELIEQHRPDIELIPIVRRSVENLELFAQEANDEFPSSLRNFRMYKEREAREAALPPITDEQAKQIRALIKEAEMDEALLLKIFKAPSVEEIRDFDRVISALMGRIRNRPRE
jgi:Arc-like DNA binding dprotein